MQANIRLKYPILTDVWVTSIFWSKVARKQKHLPRINTEFYGKKNKQNKQKNSEGNNHPLGARSKGSIGVVAVGLPHRNYSVFKQAHIN